MRVRWQRIGEATGPVGGLRRLIGHGTRREPAWQPSAEWLARMEANASVAPSPLQGVVGVGRAVEASGVTVELLAVELREGGAILPWRAHATRDVVLLGAQASVTDQLGTRYMVTMGSGGGDSRHWAGETIVVPRPPDGAALRIVVESFGPTPDRPVPPHLQVERIDGPWIFDVQLPRDIR